MRGRGAEEVKGARIGAVIAVVAIVLAVLLMAPQLLPSGQLGNDGNEGRSGIFPPENLSPAAGYVAYGANVTLEWTSDPDVDSYSIVITVPGSLIGAINLTSTTNRYELNGELPDGEYLWRVQAIEDGAYGPFSEATFFILKRVMDAPSLQSPADGSVHVNSVPTLRWSEVIGAEGYRVQVSRDTEFGSIVTDVQVSGNAYTPTFVMEDGTVYSWRVSAYQGEVWSNWSGVRQFSHNYFLAAPMPVSPASGSAVDGGQVNLTWSPVDGTQSYRLQVSSAADFSALVVNVEVADEWYLVPAELDSGTTYHWRVQAVNGATTSSWCTAYHFTVAQDAIPFSYTWTYSGRSWSLSGSVPGSDYYYLSGLARTYDYASYVMDDDPTVIAVATQLKGMADSNGYDVASFILAFVQSLDYSNDPNGREYPRYPAETLVDGGGDCEDTAALFASLVQCSAVNIDAVLLMYDYPDQNGHMAAGIAGAYSGHTERDQNGQEYYYCETTGEHFAVGQFPADFPPGYTVTVLQC
jgi:hypothetical protein